MFRLGSIAYLKAFVLLPKQFFYKAKIGISNRYEIEFIEIGADKDQVHFLVQTIPRYSPSQVVRIIKSITAK